MIEPASHVQSRSKRRLLFGSSSKQIALVFPPWAQFVEEKFTACGKCETACPENIISVGMRKLPVIDFNMGECTFCGNCVVACEEDVFIPEERPWHHEVLIADTCLLEAQVYCRSCGDSCPERAINFYLQAGNSASIQINHDSCTGCGACVSTCPQSAVSVVPKTEVQHV